jgi:putative redox protein
VTQNRNRKNITKYHIKAKKKLNMKIEVRRVNDAFLMEAENADGNKLFMDASPAIGGVNGGFRPTELLLAAAGGCSSIDIIEILKKQKQPLQELKVTIEGEREKDVIPSLFRKIHLHYTLKGDLDKGKVERAISLSTQKYCSVIKTLEHVAKITHSYSIEK